MEILRSNSVASLPSVVPCMRIAREHSRVLDYVALTRPRLNLLVAVTTGVAFVLGTQEAPSPAHLLVTTVGTGLVAAGASALNQVWERRTDRMMRRTRLRPLPDGRLRPAAALVFALLLSIAGLAALAWGINFKCAGVALLSLVTYIIGYTPLKARTSLSTIVGAVPGALPAVIGSVAATNAWTVNTWILFAIVFMWQIPHFLAIAWMYRHDYARANIRLLPVVDPDGRSTGRQAVLYAAALLPTSLMPVLTALAGCLYLVGALVLGGIVLWLAVTFATTRTESSARRLFAGTILYLPLLWVTLLADHFGLAAVGRV